MAGVPADAVLTAAAEHWTGVGLATGPADRVAAGAALHEAYRAAGRTPPRHVVWLGSPAAGALAVALLTGAVSEAGPVAAELAAQGCAAVHPGASLRARLREDLPAPARSALLDAVYGQHDAGWLAAFAALGRTDDPPLAPLAGLARSAGWWWAYDEVAVLTERPAEVHRDNVGRLHRGDGPALAYPDGYALHAWRGMPVPTDLLAELPRLTANRITAEPNAELRRIMLEHYGYERYLREAGARRVHHDECGTLWRLTFRDDEPLTMVEVVNATPEPDGEHRVYWLRVPPRTSTAREGVAWTFGLTAEEYAPLVQT